MMQFPWQSYLARLTGGAGSRGAAAGQQQGQQYRQQATQVPPGRRPTVQPTKQQAGYYTTGPDERRTVMINGQAVRMAPNTTITPATPAPKPSMWESFYNAMTGRSTTVEPPSGVAGVRGARRPAVPAGWNGGAR